MERRQRPEAADPAVNRDRWFPGGPTAHTIVQQFDGHGVSCSPPGPVPSGAGRTCRRMTDGSVTGHATQQRGAPWILPADP